ncbi:STRESS RESPONSE PROTEIN NST1-RELATED [Salix koriyanagi]|uniref:STRESS RESPONSE PROTEIN NST1-RELATED n=1 Tax=Salix koriyanagi TaxID=2511006 RepID=A0A9Q0V041_9ROSI|nr:STRESS RESPONSE PROTEIN NST1-RELATED [Salix koriyanagi]
MEGPCDFIPEEPELFEDPCYIPDPISLLGPVSESLDNFQLDLGNGFAPDTGIGLERLYAMKNVSASPEVTRPSPIESPLSRQRTADEKNNGSNWFSTTPISHDFNTQPVNDMHVNETGTWQMWNSSPLGQDGLGLVGGPGSWLSLPEQNRSTKEDIIPPPSHKTMASLFTKDDQILPGSNTPFSLKPPEESTQSEMIYQSPTGAATNNAFGPSPVHNCSKNEWGVQGSGEGFGNSSVTRPNVGGLFSTSDVQWSFD